MDGKRHGELHVEARHAPGSRSATAPPPRRRDSMWARVPQRVEGALQAMPFRDVGVVRPAVIRPGPVFVAAPGSIRPDDATHSPPVVWPTRSRRVSPELIETEHAAVRHQQPMEAPALRIALQPHFESGVLNCTLDDPEERKSKRRLDIPLSRPKLFEGYRPFREWLNEAPDTRRQTVRGRRFRVADFRDVDLSVGLDEGLLN